jgi:hypothetical protein
MLARARSRVAILGFGLIACRPSSGPTEVASDVVPAEQPKSLEAPAPAWTPLPSAIRWPPGALAIELPPGDPAAWLLPPFEPGHDDPLDRLRMVAHGERIGLARSGELLLATDRDEGLLGTIALPPGIGWIGVGGGDRIFATDANGKLFTADTVTEALEHGLRATGAVLDDVVTWDAAGERVLAVVGSAVLVSEDGGRSFRSTEPAPGVTVVTAVVRADGVMVALTRKRRVVAYVSSDGGRSWRRSSWHPESLEREDAWIMGWDGGEMGVLSSDGRSWAGDLGRMSALGGFRSWSWDFSSGELEPMRGRWPTPTDPPAPPPPERPLRNPARDDSVEGGVPGGVMGGIIGHRIDGGGATCNGGLACLHGSVGDAPSPSQLDLRTFGDARCEVETATACPFEHWRPPHVGVFDHAAGSLRLGRLPRTCHRVELAQARGLGLIRCLVTGETSLLVVAPDGTTHDELEVGFAKPEIGYVMMAEDGTLLVPEIPACFEWARAWVRRPVAPGTPEAWTVLEVQGARTWRPVGRGYAVAVADHPGGQGRSADLWLAGPGIEPKRVVEGIPVLVGVTDVRVDDGRVSLYAEGWKVVRRDGSLAEVELPSRERVVGGVIVTRARPSLGCEGGTKFLE